MRMVIQLTIGVILIFVASGKDLCDNDNHQTIPNIGYRYVNYIVSINMTPFHDSLLAEAWYFVGDFDEKMPEHPPKDFNTCGTRFPIWLNGSHPKVQGAPVDRTACRMALHDNCSESYPIQILKCKTFFLYYLKPTKSSGMGYCFGIGKEGTATSYTSPKPKVNAELHVITPIPYESITRFNCEFKQSVDPLKYVVTWYRNGAPMFLTSPADKWTDESLYMDEKIFVSRGFRMGNNIACSVTAFTVVKGPPGKPSSISDNFFAGIKILTPSLNFNTKDDASKKTIRIQPTVPIGCQLSNHCKLWLFAFIPKPAVTGKCTGLTFKTPKTNCGVKLDSSNYSKVYEINITSNDMTSLYPTDGVYDVHLRTETTNAYNTIWGNYTLPTIRVHVTTEKNKVFEGRRCYSHNDPHIRTFDGRLYDNHQEGTYILYQNIKYNTEIQVQYHACGYRLRNGTQKPIKCNCGIAVRAGRDAYVINVCGGNMKMDYISCGDNVLKVESITDSHYKLSFPYGTYADVSIYGHYMNIDVLPSGHDETNLTRGLCGIMDSYCTNDYHYRPGDPSDISKLGNGACNSWKGGDTEFDSQPVHFIHEWRVKADEDNLFTKVYDVNNYIPWHILACVCTHDLLKSGGGSDIVVTEVPCKHNGMADCGPGKPVGVNSCATKTKHRRSIERSLIKPVVEIKHDTFNASRHKRDVSPEKNWTIAEATTTCNEFMRQSPVFDLCGKVPSVDPSEDVETCIADIMLTGGTEWSSVTMEAMQNACLSELQRNTSLRDAAGSGPSIAEIIEEKACPNNCSSIGTCTHGICVCDDGFGGSDCSIDLSRGPTIAGLLDNGLCDEQHLDCDHAYVFGHMFTNNVNLTCKLEEFQIDDKGSRTNTSTLHVQGDFDTMIEVACPIHQTRHRRAMDNRNSTFVLGYTISVSNDGNVYEPGKDLFIYDSSCQVVTNISNELHFSRKDNFCFINNKCIPEGQSDGVNKCNICNTALAIKAWSINTANKDCVSKNPHNGTRDELSIKKTHESEGNSPNYLWIIGVVGGVILGVVVGVIVVIKLRKSRRKRFGDSRTFEQSTNRESEQKPSHS